MDSSNENQMGVMDYIDVAKGYWSKSKRYLPIALIVGLLIGMLMYYRTSKKEPIYSAYSTLMTTESAAGPNVSAYSNLASQFGISNLNMSVNSEKLLELLQYKKIVTYPLFKEVQINGDRDLLINHFIKLNGYHERWAESQMYKDFLFKHDDIEAFSDVEQDVLKKIHQNIVANHLSATISKNGIIRVSFKSNSGEFTQLFLAALVESLGDFFVDKTIAQDLRNYDFIESRLDSITIELKKAEGGLAAAQDRTTGLVYSSGFVNQQRQLRNVEILNEMYIESVKRFESAKLSLLKNTPIIQIIDQPIRPLFPKRHNAIQAALIGFFASFFIFMFLIILVLVAKSEFQKLKQS